LRHNWCKKSKKLYDDLTNIILLKKEHITYNRSSRRNGKRWSKNSTRCYRRLIKNTDIKLPEILDNLDYKLEINFNYPFQLEMYYDSECYPNMEECGFQYFV
jgi:hypothetical protein